MAMRLCRRHYDRLRYRRRQGIALAFILSPAGIHLLTTRTRVAAAEMARYRDTAKQPIPRSVWPTDEMPTTCSCLTCANLLVQPPRFLLCAKEQWPDGILKLAIKAVEACGLPEAIQQYGRNCPYYAISGQQHNIVGKEK